MRDTLKLGPKGRVVIPIDARRHLGIAEGDELCLVLKHDSIELMPRAAVLARLRAIGSTSNTSPVDELLADRRAAARAEAS